MKFVNDNPSEKSVALSFTTYQRVATHYK